LPKQSILCGKDGQLFGDNTDGQGLVDAILALNWSLKNTRILILGAGGATRGVIYPLVKAGAKQITIANRTLTRAEQLISDLESSVPEAQLNMMQLSKLSGEYDLVINATSASLSGEALVLPQSLNFIMLMKWLMANHPPLLTKPKLVVCQRLKVLVCSLVRLLKLLPFGMVLNQQSKNSCKYMIKSTYK
jgi:hypothetical protein